MRERECEREIVCVSEKGYNGLRESALVRPAERECEGERESECVCERERECVCEGERVSVCVCVCVCVKERKRESARAAVLELNRL